MSGNDDIDFKTQLEYEEREKRIQENSTSTADPYSYTDPNDGTVYEWNHQKQAWFPKVSEDFLAAYQASYGQEYNTQEQNSSVGTSMTTAAAATPSQDTGQTKKLATEDERVKPEGSDEKRKATDQQGWFEVDDQHNTNVYVSNLPDDITDEEFVDLMSKCGIIMKDGDTGKLKMKLYRDNSGHLKGDGRCCYIKVESVDLALKILDGYNLRNKEIHVERAKFQMKGDYDPSRKPKKKKLKDKKKIQQLQSKLLDWRPERMRGERLRHERTVIIKNMFDPKEFEEDVTLILEYQNDLKEECAKFGTVKKVVVYDRHPDGIASVTFQEAEMADACVEALNGRWFAKRQLHVETHDGKTKYNILETAEEREERLKKWENYLDKEQKKQEQQS